MGEAENRLVVDSAFAAWADGEGNVFDILADDAQWTITGTSRFAGLYTSRQEFLDEVIKPLGEVLAVPIRPTVRSIVADGDWVVVLWDGEATATDGVPYNNSYCWHLRLHDSAVVEAIAFFDSISLNELLDRVARTDQ